MPCTIKALPTYVLLLPLDKVIAILSQPVDIIKDILPLFVSYIRSSLKHYISILFILIHLPSLTKQQAQCFASSNTIPSNVEWNMTTMIERDSSWPN